MNFSNKCYILADFYYYYRNEPTWREFSKVNDIALPLAWLINIGAAESTERGNQWIEDTWSRFCAFVGVDPDGNYATLSILFDNATNVGPK